MKKQILITIAVMMICSFFANTVFAKNRTSITYSLTTSPHDSLSVVAPNVFSPNGDGINDTWSIIVHDYGIALIDLETTVYDRWGKQIFQSTNIHQVWSGHNSIGKPCEDGTYFFVVSYTNGATNKLEVHKGFVELLR